MPTLNLPEALYQQLQQDAQIQGTTIDALVAQRLQDKDSSSSLDTIKLGIPDILPYMVYIENVPQGNHAYVNTYTEAFFGINLREIQAVGMQYVREKLHPDDLQQLAGLLTDWSQVSDDDIIHKEYRLRNQQGDYRWFRTIERVYSRDETGQVTQILGTAIDVHERVIAEAAARQNSTIYRELAANLPKSAVMVLDADLRYIVAAGEVLTETGFNPKNIQGQRMQDVLDTSDFTIAHPLIEQAFAGQRQESIITYTNGKTYRVVYAPLGDDDCVDYALILITDLTQEKQNERKAYEAKQQLELAIEAGRIGMWQLDPKTNILDWNQQLYDIYALTPEDLRKDLNVWREMVHPEDRAHANKELKRIFNGERISIVNFRIIRKNGEVRYINATGATVKDAQGDIVYLVGFNIDVTHIVEAQRALIQVESRYESLFNSIHHHVVIYDKDARIITINETAAHNIGYKPYELQGQLIGDIVPGADILILRNINTVLETQAPVNTEDILTVNGDDLWWWSSTQPIFDEDGMVRYVQIISYDITDQKMAEKWSTERVQLQQDLEHEQALAQQRQQMFSVLSHEVKTPLAIIMNSVEFLTTYRDHLTPERQAQRFEQIQAQVLSLNTLFDEIANQIKFDQDFMEFAPTPTPIIPVLSSYLSQLELLVSSHQTLEVHLAISDLILTIDERLLYHAVSNIISNAIKYSPDGGVIQVRTNVEDDYFVLVTQDNGIGISEEDLKRVFSAFERGNNVGQIRGTGMGLAIVRDIAALHGGTVDIISEQGVGTTFYLRLPLNSAKDAESNTN